MRTAISCLMLAVAFGTTALMGQAPEKKEPEPKAKGQLPPNWKMLGLTEKQTQDIYKIEGKYKEEIDKLEAQIKEAKSKMTKERMDVLTAEQKKKLEDILKEKAGTGTK